MPYEDLKMFKNDVTEWVIAKDLEEVWKVYEEHTGLKQDDPDNEDIEWKECPPESTLTYHGDAEDYDLDGSEEDATKTCAQWAKHVGKPCYFATTEF